MGKGKPGYEHSASDVEYKRRKYPLVSFGVQCQGYGKRIITIGSERLLHAFEENNPGWEEKECEESRIDEKIFEYQPDEIIRSDDIPAIIRNMNDDVKWEYWDQQEDDDKFGPERELAVEILDKFEELLDSKDITIPSSDREGSPDEARLYGSEYFALEDGITDILKRQPRLRNKETILEALKDYRRWFDADSQSDAEKLGEIEAAIIEVQGKGSGEPAFCPAMPFPGGGGKRLPMVTLIDGKTFFIDLRLSQLRNVSDPYDYIDL
jgi:hypothetical protein